MSKIAVSGGASGGGGFKELQGVRTESLEYYAYIYADFSFVKSSTMYEISILMHQVDVESRKFFVNGPVYIEGSPSSPTTVWSHVICFATEAGGYVTDFNPLNFSMGDSRMKLDGREAGVRPFVVESAYYKEV